MIRGIFPNFPKLLQEYKAGENVSPQTPTSNSTVHSKKRARISNEKSQDAPEKSKAAATEGDTRATPTEPSKEKKKGRRAKKRQKVMDAA